VNGGSLSRCSKVFVLSSKERCEVREIIEEGEDGQDDPPGSGVGGRKG